MPRSDRGRFSAKRKRDAVLRLLRGEDLDILARELGVNAPTLAKWRDAFLESGLNGLKSRAQDDRDERIKDLERKLGQVTMDNELLNAKIDAMEAGDPLARRRSRR
jgi:transposase-like protein